MEQAASKPMKDKDRQMELELVARSRLSSEGAFEELARRHMPGVYRLCLRFAENAQEAEDMMQESFVLAYRALGRFRGQASFSSWLFRIVLNLCRSKLRTRYREQRKIEKLRGLAPTAADPPENADDLKAIVRERIDRLPDRQREVVLLHLQEMPYDEIARVLDVTYEDVKTNLSLARKRLRKELGHLLKE